MLCSQCSAPVRPVVAVDIDGTLGNYHEHFHAFAEAYVGHALPPWYPGGGEFSDHLALDKRVYRDIKLAYRQGAQKRSMPVYPGAVRFMATLEALGLEVWICTTRPYMRLDNIDPDTREWMERNSIHYDAMVYDDDKYKQLIELVNPARVLAVIDDLYEQCELANGLGLDVWQPQRAHNEAERWGATFSNFPWMTEYITAKAAHWEKDQTYVDA